MRIVLSVGLMVVLGGLGAGCAEHHALRTVRAPGYLVPTAAIIQDGSVRGVGTAEQMLPSSDGDIWIARGEKSVAGNTSIAEFSAISVYTYDVQTIANQHGSYGYRYRVGVQSAISVP